MNYTQPISDMALQARELAARQAVALVGSRRSDVQGQSYDASRNAFAAEPRTVDVVWRERLLLQDTRNAERLAAWRSRRAYFVGYMEGGR